jgi:glutamate/tyrosine decarboxylase-like PLP-dependent enzyme
VFGEAIDWNLTKRKFLNGYFFAFFSASPSIAGSRPGSIIAGTWAALMYMGKEGYLESCRSIVGAAKRLEKAIREDIPELEVLGKPLVSVVAFKETKGMGVNIYQLGDYLGSKGWHCEFGLAWVDMLLLKRSLPSLVLQ